MAVITLEINAIDRSNQVDWESISVEQVLTKEPDSMTFRIKNYGTKTYLPSLGQEVELISDAVKQFSGIIVEMNQGVDGYAQFTQINCKDHTYSLDSKLVSKSYTNMTIDAIIADLITNFAPTFTGVNVVAPTLIGKVVFNYLPFSNALQKLVELSAGYDWYVDYDKDIHFFQTSIQPAPFNLTDTSGNYIWGSLDLHRETHQLKNEIIVRGGEVLSASARTEVFNGDGVQLIFPTGSKFSNVNASGVPVKPTVIVNAVAQTVGIDFKDPEAGFNCFWNFNEKYIRFKLSTVPPSGTNNITISGIPLFPLIVSKQNQTSILTYGLFQYLIVDLTIKDLTTAEDRADAELALYSDPIYTGRFRTYETGLMTGQSINVASVIRNTDQDYKIQAITIRLHSLTSLVFDVELVRGEDLGINDILTRLLITNTTSQIDIQQDEVVQRFSVFNETAFIVDSVPVITTSITLCYDWDFFLWDFGAWCGDYFYNAPNALYNLSTWE